MVEHHLFTDRVMADLKQRAQSGLGNGKSAAEFVLTTLEGQDRIDMVRSPAIGLHGTRGRPTSSYATVRHVPV
jgi:hypothetical protein